MIAVVAESVRLKDNVIRWVSLWVHLLNLSGFFVIDWLLQRIQPKLKSRFNLSWLVAYVKAASTGVGTCACCLLSSSKESDCNCTVETNQVEVKIKLVSVTRHQQYYSNWIVHRKFLPIFYVFYLYVFVFLSVFPLN